MLPHFLCIGAQKAGTTWLHAMLSQHPEIYLGPIKEYHYFDTIYLPAVQRWSTGHVMKGVRTQLQQYLNNNKTLDSSYINYLSRIVDKDILFTENWYRHIYSPSQAQRRIRGDITPAYCCIPSEGVRYIKQLMPDTKIIYMIRHPYDRAISQLRMNISRAGYTKSISKSEWNELIEDPVIHSRGNYKTYIPRWESIMGTSSILYVPFRDIENNPDNTLRKIEDHLGLGLNKYNNSKSKIHKTKHTRIPKSVQNDIKDIVNPQVEFLSQHFGSDFVNKI